MPPQRPLRPRFQSILGPTDPRKKWGQSWFAFIVLSLLHSLWRYITQLDVASFLHYVSSFPNSCLPCFLFLFPLFSRMFLSRTASVLSSPGTSLPEYLLSPLLPSLSLFLRVSLETGLVAWLPSAAFFFFMRLRSDGI